MLLQLRLASIQTDVGVSFEGRLSLFVILYLLIRCSATGMMMSTRHHRALLVCEPADRVCGTF